MYIFALFIGIYSYSIFLLGIVHSLYQPFIFIANIILLTVVCILLISKNNIKISIRILNNRNKIKNIRLWFLFLLFVLVNSIGALAPELAFDALWYHLTLPKIYLTSQSILHIPGGLLYYSDMPKLGEMLFVGGLSFGSEIINKFIQLLFGILTCWFIYKIAKEYFDARVALFAVLIYYGNLVVAWESTTAYIDLIRSFFEIAAFSAFLLWFKSHNIRWFVIFSLMVGLAISSKLLGIGTLFIFSLLIFIILFNKWQKMVIYLFMLWILALFVVLPWFLFSYINTGNFVYPFFTPLYPANSNANLHYLFQDIWQLFMHESDPLSPVYIVFIPLIILFFSKLKKEVKLMGFYSLLALLTWFVTPRTGGGRFILPYLPVFSLLCAGVLSYLTNARIKKVAKILEITILTVFIISLLYRMGATVKYIPVVLGIESKHTFLSNNLNYQYGDFYDTDNYFKYHINTNDVILLYGYHNLYYVNFPYIDSSWVKEGDKFNYISTQNTKLPSKFYSWHLVYENQVTGVKLFKPPSGECDSYCIY